MYNKSDLEKSTEVLIVVIIRWHTSDFRKQRKAFYNDNFFLLPFQVTTRDIDESLMGASEGEFIHPIYSKGN